MSRKQVYINNLLIIIGFCILGFWKDAWGCYTIASLIFIGSILHVKLALRIAKGWLFIGKTLGNINAKILLTLFYFLALVPIAVLKRLFASKAKKEGTSAWRLVDQSVNFNNPF